MSYKGRVSWYNHICFDCRVSFKDTEKCPHCNKKLKMMKADFLVPKKNNIKMWKKLERYCLGYEIYKHIELFSVKIDVDNYPYKLNKMEVLLALNNAPKYIYNFDYVYCAANGFLMNTNPCNSRKSFLRSYNSFFEQQGMVYENIYTGRRFS